jgi:hypothetical protein
MQTYKNLIRATVTHTHFCLPVSLALHLASLSDPRVHEIAHSILTEISYFLQVYMLLRFEFTSPICR